MHMSNHCQDAPSQTQEAWKIPWRMLIGAGALVLLAVLLRGFVVHPRLIVSGSMEPTPAVGDRLVVDTLSYRFHPLRAGDIVVFEPPPELVRWAPVSGTSRFAALLPAQRKAAPMILRGMVAP